MGVPGISSTGSQSSEILYYSGPFQSSHSFYLAICTLSLRLLGILRPISSKPPGFCPQVERGTVTVRPQFWFQQFPCSWIIFQRRAVWLIAIKRSFYTFSFCLCHSFRASWSCGPSFYFSFILRSFCVLHSFHPPHPRRGDLGHHWPAFTGLIFIYNGHTWIFFFGP